ncbi:helix-turn-helix domain-containing protein [Micromonospora carbonacea]|uniref:AraC family transcriptional regulator n=1 Tax=Micromonospora carbonacea TaxID=47853 RepID=A0A7H8XDF4_9ACTN|nr:helix-turn-helix domain-containing protein [Micromonospora carbonacea]MBB5829598.1 AraC-like DNA-binding protein [Micromonospora carbonacea]QLD23006.1 AraC family transcriptional regulator [Micromonospora carbonacea]
MTYGSHGPPVLTRFSTSDPAEAAHVFETAYGRSVRLAAVPTGLPLRHDRWNAGAFCIDDISISLDLRVQAEPLGYVLLAAPRRGCFGHRCDGVDELIGPGEVGVLYQPDLPGSSWSSDLDVTSVLLDLSLFDQVARVDPDRPLTPLRFASFRSVCADAQWRWRQTVRYAESVIAAGGAPGASPLVLGGLGRLLAAATLAAFPSNAVVADRPCDRADAHAGTLRRAIAFIESAAGTDIGLVDIARAAATTPRAVQLAFRSQLGTTPLAYLRRVRLDLARRDLTRAVPGDGVSVAAVAARWGFADPRRFAARYLATYGELPGRTLRR